MLICERLDEVDNVERFVEGVIFGEGLDFFYIAAFFLSFFLFFLTLLEVGRDFVEAGSDVAINAKDEVLVALVLFMEMLDFFENEGDETVMDLS